MWSLLRIGIRVVWLLILESGVLGIAIPLASLAYSDGPRKRRNQLIQRIYVIGFFIVEGIEVLLFINGPSLDDSNLLSPFRIFVGLDLFGIVVTIYMFLPLIYGWRIYRESSLEPVRSLAAWLGRLQANPLLVFDEKESQGFSRELKRLTDRRPLLLGKQLKSIRGAFLALSQEPPKDVCLQRAVDFLIKNRSAEALAWARRWKPDSFEFFLLCLERQAWNECVLRLDQVSLQLERLQLANVFREEVLQILGDLPDLEGMRASSREKLTDNRDMRRRRAVLEFKGGRIDVALKLLEHDWEASNWVRSAQASMNSRSPLPASAQN